MTWHPAIGDEISSLFSLLSVPEYRGYAIVKASAHRHESEEDRTEARRDTWRASKAKARDEDPEAMRAAWRAARDARKAKDPEAWRAARKAQKARARERARLAG